MANDRNKLKSARIHICHVASALKGGSEIMISQLAASQMAAGHQVSVIYSPIRDELESFAPLFLEGTNFIPWPVGRDVNLGSDVNAYVHIAKILSTLKPDIVHLHNSKAGALGRIVCRKLHLPCIYTPHGLPFLRRDIAWWKRKLHYTAEWTLALFGGWLVALSQSERQAIRSMPCRKAMINNGIDITSIRKAGMTPIDEYPYRGFRIVLSGRIETPKNPHFVASLAEQCPEHWEWIWIGDGSLAYMLERSERIKVTGWMPRAKALSLVRSADAFLQASLWEGMSFALLEAMALGRPCVVSNVVGNRDLISHEVSGYVCDRLDEYIAILERIALHPEETAKVGATALKYVTDNFDLAVISGQWAGLYAEVLRDSKKDRRLDSGVRGLR